MRENREAIALCVRAMALNFDFMRVHSVRGECVCVCVCVYVKKRS